LKDNFNHKPAAGTEELLDRVFAHILHWDLNCDEEDSMAKLVSEKIKSNGTLQLITKLHQPLPELLIYQFNGTTSFDTFRSEDIVPDEQYENFTVPTRDGHTLVFSKSELDSISSTMKNLQTATGEIAEVSKKLDATLSKRRRD
jgi:hypothetical protein